MKRVYNSGFWAILLAFAALLMGFTAHAIDVTISGQVNRAVLYADDDKSANRFVVDNDNSSFRFRFGGGNFEFRDGSFSSSASVLFDFGLNFTASYAFASRMTKTPGTCTTNWVTSSWGFMLP